MLHFHRFALASVVFASFFGACKNGKNEAQVNIANPNSSVANAPTEFIVKSTVSILGRAAMHHFLFGFLFAFLFGVIRSMLFVVWKHKT